MAIFGVGHAPIDDCGASEIGRGHQAILPGAREQREIERAIRAAACELGEQRTAQLKHVFAYAAALAQRRPVVEEDAHSCLSLSDSVSYIST